MRKCVLAVLTVVLSLSHFLNRAYAQELLQPPVPTAEPAARNAGEKFTPPPAMPMQPVVVGGWAVSSAGVIRSRFTALDGSAEQSNSASGTPACHE